VSVVLGAISSVIASVVFVAPSQSGGGRADRVDPTDDEVSHRTPAGDIPEGRLIVQLNSGIEVIAGDERWSIASEDERIVGYDVSPDGSTIVAASYVTEPTHYTREYELLAIETSSGEKTVLAEANVTEDFGPAVWSPDGTEVAYRLSTLSADPAAAHPGDPIGQTVCVVDVATQTSRCSPDLGTVDGFSWSPDGDQLIVDGVGPELGLRVVDLANSVVSEPISPRDPALVDALGGNPPDSFVFAEWSSSGEFVATLAHPHVVTVFDSDGPFLMLGHRTREFSDAISWSPTRDLLAYAIGRPPYSITDVYVLDVQTGEDRLLLSTGEGEQAPIVRNIAWSPSGRWMAIVVVERGLYLPESVHIVDVAGDLPSSVIELPPTDASEVLIGWAT
jgi:Tol biopolymer transport system component